MYDNKLINALFYAAVAVIAFTFIGLLLSGPLISSQYNSYDITDECEIVSKDDKVVRNKHNYHIEYQYDFKYTVGNEVFENTTSWLREDYDIGDWVMFKYDSNNPENSLLEIEKTEATATSIAVVLVSIITGGLYLFFKR